MTAMLHHFLWLLLSTIQTSPTLLPLPGTGLKSRNLFEDAKKNCTFKIYVLKMLNMVHIGIRYKAEVWANRVQRVPGIQSVYEYLLCITIVIFNNSGLHFGRTCISY